MKLIARIVFLILSSIRLLPHILVLVIKLNNELIISDLKRWADVKEKIIKNKLQLVYYFAEFMTSYPEYRNQFYKRLGWLRHLLQPLCMPMTTLFIKTENIGPGLFIQHGFCTIISAKRIGMNCWINQQVTIGYSNDTDCPVIGDNVIISAGAKVIGKVKIGNNSKVGANAVVIKDVPENCTVVGIPAYIVRKNGVKCKEEL